MKTFRGRPEDEDYIDSDDGAEIDLDDPDSLNNGYLDLEDLVEPEEEIFLDDLDLDDPINRVFRDLARQEDDTVSIDTESEEEGSSLLDVDADSEISASEIIGIEGSSASPSGSASKEPCDCGAWKTTVIVNAIPQIDENSMESLELAISEADKLPNVGVIQRSKDFLVPSANVISDEEVIKNDDEKHESKISDGSEPNSPQSSRVESEPASAPPSENGDGANDSFCNPMASDTEGDGEDETLRGDRIGSTTYSERHVLKILMDWMKNLSEFGKRSKRNEEADEDDGPSVDKPLEPELEESMALLWDMSAEKDVMKFLLDNNILLMIRDNLDCSECPSRLKEIGLGILANLLSCSDILESFPEKDENIDLFERVLFEAINGSKVPVLIQAFAVLRRMICYVRNATPVKRWMDGFLDEGFIKAANFLLASSTSPLLLGDVITLYFTLMEVLYPLESNDATPPTPSVEDNFQPILHSDYVPSLCEALSELMKHLTSKDIGQLVMPPTDPYRLPQCDTSEMKPLEDIAIPSGLVQTSILNGLASFCYLLKLDNGKEQLRQHNQTILNLLLCVLQKFNVCMDRIHKPEILDHYASTLDLLNYCHSNLPRVLPTAIGIPAYTTVWLIQNEKTADGESDNFDRDHSAQTHLVTLRNGKTVETDVSPYILIYCNYIMDMEDKFGAAEIDAVIEKPDNKKLKAFHENAKASALKLQNSA